jgi:formate hydrogenlyase subunit 6/NADH:ubiquinone oxidoreductase subunit I
MLSEAAPSDAEPAAAAAATSAPLWLAPKDRLQQVIDELRRRSYTVVGPTIDQQAIVYGEIDSIDQLPRGVTDVQAPGSYRLQHTTDDAWFGFVVGPHSWKKYLYPSRLTLSTATPVDGGWRFESHREEPPQYALLGVRACEIAAIRVQDRVLLDGPYIDAVYQGRRERAFILAVNCTLSGANCFCVSMQTGPRCSNGFDLALTETADGFLVEIGSESGRDVIGCCDARPATPAEIEAAAAARQQAVDGQTKRMDTTNLPQMLMASLDHPRWKEVGERCLSCTNCTMVCPTCFCVSVDEVPDLNTGRVERQRQWDSCFHTEFSTLNGRPVRDDIPSRYRQWLTHKLSTWHDQFGTSGCVGCGRCITWCPVGIDLTEEVAALREAP